PSSQTDLSIPLNAVINLTSLSGSSTTRLPSGNLTSRASIPVLITFSHDGLMASAEATTRLTSNLSLPDRIENDETIGQIIVAAILSDCHTTILYLPACFLILISRFDKYLFSSASSFSPSIPST